MLDKWMHRDKLHYVINKIYVSTMRQNKVDWTDYVNLHSKILALILTTRFSPMIMRALRAVGVIECDHNYIPGEKSYGHRFTAGYRGEAFSEVPIEDGKFLGKLCDVGRQTLSKALQGHPGRQIINRCVREAEFDFRAATAFLAANEGAYMYDALAKRKFLISDFEHGDYFFGADDAGRIYHNFTSLSRDLRAFASWRGEPLYSLDVGNCQPCILGKFAPNRTWIAHCQENALYAFLNDAAGHPYDLNDDTQKSELKKRVYSEVLYCRNHLEGDLARVVKSKFPDVYRTIRDMKRDNYKNLPLTMQKIESGIVIDKVATEFAVNHSDHDSCLISVHDCLLTTEEYIQEVRESIKKHFHNAVGFEVPVKVHRISQNN
jgi:hypothetical protein